MRRCDSLKVALASVVTLCLALCAFGSAPAYGGWQLAITLTTSSPGGDLRFDPEHVHAVWAETQGGAFIKTIGRWGVVEYGHLTQWEAADGTHIDGWTGATPKAYQQHHVVWDFTDRSDQEVPDGTYRIRFELTNHNAEQNQFHRTSVIFQKDGQARSESYPDQGGYRDIKLDYSFVPTTIPEVAVEPALYVTSTSARSSGRIVDTGGEDPNVYLYWGELDAEMAAERWDNVIALGQREAQPVRVDLTGLDPATEYFYRWYTENSAGGRWTDHAERFSTHGVTGYTTGYRVQSGRTLIDGYLQDIDILPVNDTTRAFALISYGTGWQPDVENSDIVMVRGHLLDTDTLRIERSTGFNATWISWQVIECLGREFQVYRGSGTFKPGYKSVDAPLNGAPPASARRRSPGAELPDVVVDPARCIAYVTADSSQPTRTHYHEALLTAFVNTDTTVRIDRGADSQTTTDYNWVVVEFDPAAVADIQHGAVSFSGASESSPATRTIRPVDPGSSLLLYQTRTSVNGLAYSAIAGRLASADTVEFYQHTGTTGSRAVEYHVIDFGPQARAQRGQVDFSDDAGWFYADCHLTPPVNLSRAIAFHGLSCNGTGDYYPRPFATAQFTNADTLRIERQFPGQQSFIEWQVLELPPATFVGQQPDIVLDPNALAFPQTSAGAYANLTFDICNVGDADLHVHSFEFVGLNKTAYSLVSPPAVPFTVSAPAGRQTVTVRFAPDVQWDYRYAKLAVGSNDPDEPVATLSLSGIGD